MIVLSMVALLKIALLIIALWSVALPLLPLVHIHSVTGLSVNDLTKFGYGAYFNTTLRGPMSFTVSLTDKQPYVAGTKPVLSRRNQTMADDLHRAVISVSLTHGLDAAKRHEWRVLPTTDCLPERTGEQVFIWMHIPLFLVFYGLPKQMLIQHSQ
jgi:hypothetical protein